MGRLRQSIRGATEDAERLRDRIAEAATSLHGLRTSKVGTGGGSGGSGGGFVAVPFQPGRGRGAGGDGSAVAGAGDGVGGELVRTVGEGNRAVVAALESGFRSIRQAIAGAPDAAFELRRRGGL